MNAKSIRLFIITLLAALLPVIVGCARSDEANGRMDVAESLFEDRPDSALRILDSIPASALHGDREKAHYALLLSMALDKNYIDTTTFDIIRPAIDYYSEHGTPDEKLRTFYYTGRIYNNRGDENAALMQFMNAADLHEKVTDTLVLAHNYVMMAVIYHNQYELLKSIKCHLKAAPLYGSIGKHLFEIKSYACAADQQTMMENKAKADSLLDILSPLINRYRVGESYLLSSRLTYLNEFGTREDIRAFLDSNRTRGNLDYSDSLDIAVAYSKIGEYDKALDIVSRVRVDGSTADSLKYTAIKVVIYKTKGDWKEAFRAYNDYSAIAGNHHMRIMARNLKFADQRHSLEMQNLQEIQDKDRMIWKILCAPVGMLLLFGWMYYRQRLARTRRLIVEKDNENLRLAQENLLKDKERLEAEQRQHELEAANLMLEKKQLEDERDKLKELLGNRTELSVPVQEIIKARLDMLNGLLAKEITHNDNYAGPYNEWIETIRDDKEVFMNSTRLAFMASRPAFIDYLKRHGLTDDEINYLCLYAIGLRGKEVGEYIHLKRHYHISSDIRRKLGIDEHQTNLGIYIRKLMQQLDA